MLGQIKNALERKHTVWSEKRNNPNEEACGENEKPMLKEPIVATSTVFLQSKNAIANEQKSPFKLAIQSIPNVAHEFEATSTYAFDRIFSK